ncbi:MAG: acyltransferase [Bacteroidales bacterium]|nr:acyltransferase [Bacteroidales bacterium]
MNKRLFFLDNLKVFLTILVVFHHACIPFSPYGDWGYHPSNPEEVIDRIWLFISVNASFFMGLFFFISGYFIPGSYDRQGGKSFCQKKLLRLGIPLLLVTIIVSPVDHCLSFAHAWYIESLLIFSLLYALIRQFCKPINSEGKTSTPTILWLLSLSVILGILQQLIRSVSPQDSWIMFLGFVRMELAHYFQYMLMFVLGILAYRYKWLETIKNRTGIIAVIFAILLIIGNVVRNGGTWDSFVWNWFGIYESFMCVFISVALLWSFREFGNWSGKFWTWSSAQAYGAYIFHLFVLLSIENAMDSLAIHVVLKLIYACVFATIGSFVITWLFRLIPGVKKVL